MPPPVITFPDISGHITADNDVCSSEVGYVLPQRRPDRKKSLLDISLDLSLMPDVSTTQHDENAMQAFGEFSSDTVIWWERSLPFARNIAVWSGF